MFYEYSKNANQTDPYYPVNNEINKNILQNYKALAKQIPNLVIGGRLGDYAYYDMDKTIAEALKCYEQKIVEN